MNYKPTVKQSRELSKLRNYFDSTFDDIEKALREVVEIRPDLKPQIEDIWDAEQIFINTLLRTLDESNS